MYDTIYLEISGYCNAKCPWCVNGRGAIREETKKFMSASEFANILETLISNKLIDNTTKIALFNWGEPFLNPDLLKILEIICEHGCKYSLSTNASKYIKIPREFQNNLSGLIISMPGFSQESYSKIHHFSFDKIMANVAKFLIDIDYQKIRVAYHIYQFNIDEIEPAIAFFSKYGISVSPYYAYLNDYNLAQKYLNKDLPYEQLSNASKELCLGYVDKLISECPAKYQCPEWDRLTIDEWGRIITCCALPKDHPFYALNISLKNFSENISEEEIREAVRNQPECKRCIRSGLAYWGHTAKRPHFVEIYYKKYFIKTMLARYIQKVRGLFCR